MTATLPTWCLIVDDDDDIRRLVARILSRFGVRIDEARDGAEAILRAVERPHDLIVMDLMMPNLDGFRAMEAIRMVDPACPIVVVSANTDTQSRQRSAELGAIGYVQKPFEVRDIERALLVALMETRTDCQLARHNPVLHAQCTRVRASTAWNQAT